MWPLNLFDRRQDCSEISNGINTIEPFSYLDRCAFGSLGSSSCAAKYT
jgi:hypothetical protein